MIPARLLFNRATGLGDVVAQEGEIHSVDPAQAVQLIRSGRAVPAPGEPDLPPPTSITTGDLGLRPEAPPAPRRKS